ncbi:MAG: hypothetical protein ABIP80_03085, partial [Ferruginibacter sp.]
KKSDNQIKETFIIETDLPKETLKDPILPAIPDPLPVAFGSLTKIRQQLTEKNQKNAITVVLSEETLLEAWQVYINKLEVKNNHSGVTNFKQAELKSVGNNAAEIIVTSAFHQKFIEAERSDLIEHFRSYFNNSRFTYNIKIVSPIIDDKETEKQLSAKEQYQKLIEEYPNIKELRERLKLELDINTYNNK